MFGLRRRSLALALSVSSLCMSSLSVSAIDGINIDVDELIKFISSCGKNGQIKDQQQKELVIKEKEKFLDYGTRDGICYFAVTKPEDLFSVTFDTAKDDMLTSFDYLDLKIANAVFDYVKGLSGAFIDFLSQLRDNCDKKVNNMYGGIPANKVSWNSSSKNGYYFSLAGGFIVPFYDNCDIDGFTKVLFPPKSLTYKTYDIIDSKYGEGNYDDCYNYATGEIDGEGNVTSKKTVHTFEKKLEIQQYVYAKFAQLAMSFGLVTYFKDLCAVCDKTKDDIYAPKYADIKEFIKFYEGKLEEFFEKCGRSFPNDQTDTFSGMFSACYNQNQKTKASDLYRKISGAGISGMRLFDNRAMYNYQLFNLLKFKNFTEFRYTIQYIEGFIDMLIGGAGKKVYSSWVERITEKYWGDSIKFGNN